MNWAGPNQKWLGALTGARGKTGREGVETKKDYLIGHSLKPNWQFVIGCPECLDFITLRPLHRFWAETLEPLQSNGLYVISLMV